MSYIKPYLTAEISAYNCLHDIRINDGFVMKEHDFWGELDDVPINEWLQPGENELSVELKPFNKQFYEDYYGEDEPDNADRMRVEKTCKFSISLRVHESGNMAQQEHLFNIAYNGDYAGEQPKLSITQDRVSGSASGRYAYTHTEEVVPAEDGSLVVGDISIEATATGSVKIKRRFSLDVPFPRWRYLDSDIIEDNDETKRSLFEEYQNIRKALSNKELDKLSMLFAERAEELEAAYYLSPGESDMGKAFAEVVNDPSLTLLTTAPEKYEETYGYSPMVVYANNRLAKITLWNGDDFIGFNYDEGGSRVFGVTFRRQNGKWIIAR